ncbi:hypothetical protein A2899_02815 [Candidatus Amesbacteria bacterium RIFCSPLOWO2_01_FULL_49_25]|nr:MAG: hypothetical protein A2899_02815 [Candidatus Amesbacteria bacterium RIFCSPLOWO2_01_FULL_49_25]
MVEMTLKQAVEEYKNVYMPARNFSTRTRVEYANDIEDLTSFVEQNGIHRVGMITLPTVERYLAELDRRGIAGATRKRKVVSIRSFLTFLYQDGYIATNIGKRIIPPRTDFKNPRFLTEREYKRLLDAASQNPRDFAIIQLLLQTGIKLSEITRLSLNDVELSDTKLPEQKEGGYLHIIGSERQKERTIPLNNKACTALGEYVKRRSLTKNNILFINRFGKRLSPRGIEKITSKYFDQTEIEGATVQSLRHTFGIHHVAKGTSLKTIQAIMGHKDPRSTAIYVSLIRETTYEL